MNVLLVSAISGLLAVALGAFGAHGLKARLSSDMLAVYETAVQYHFWHTLALLGVAVLLQQGFQVKLSANLFFAGTVIFSGSLYILAVSGVKWLGAITPIGGVLLIAGWASLAVAAYRGV